MLQARAARRHAAAEAAADARTVLRKEAEWMSRQPKARQVHSSAAVFVLCPRKHLLTDFWEAVAGGNND